MIARSFGLAAILFLLSCCGVRDVPRESALDRASDKYIKLVAALGERDPDSLDYYAGPAELLAQVRAEDASGGVRTIFREPLVRRNKRECNHLDGSTRRDPESRRLVAAQPLANRAAAL